MERNPSSSESHGWRFLIPDFLFSYSTQHLIHLDILKNLTYELIGSPVTQRSAKRTHAQTDQHHVPEVKRRLHQPVHARLEHKVINAVEEDVQRRAPARVERRPLPQVILRVEAKVHHDDGGHAHHQAQDGVDAQQEAVDVVELVIPQRREDVVELDEDASEGEEAGEGYEVGRDAVPGRVLRDGSRDGVDAARKGLRFVAPELGVASEERSEDAERDRYEDPQEEQFEQHQEGNVVDGAVDEGDAVEDGEDHGHDGGEEEHGEHHGELPLRRPPDPGCPGRRLGPAGGSGGVVQLEIAPRSVSRHDAGEGVEDEDGGEDLPPLLVDLPVQRTRHGEEHHAHDQGDDLPSRS
mmetsp:Transcript_8172/g.17490  ORF Transcript_8172/g.17490 Transcript_8172/m.17490 type:complete len:352 (+) Transcript_8172:281-1336(+)